MTDALLVCRLAYRCTGQLYTCTLGAGQVLGGHTVPVVSEQEHLAAQTRPFNLEHDISIPDKHEELIRATVVSCNGTNVTMQTERGQGGLPKIVKISPEMVQITPKMASGIIPRWCPESPQKGGPYCPQNCPNYSPNGPHGPDHPQNGRLNYLQDGPNHPQNDADRPQTVGGIIPKWCPLIKKWLHKSLSNAYWYP